MAGHILEPGHAFAQGIGDIDQDVAVEMVFLGPGDTLFQMPPQELPDVPVAHTVGPVEILAAQHDRVDFRPEGDRTAEQRLERGERADRLVHELDPRGRQILSIRVAPQRQEGAQPRLVRQARAVAVRTARIGPPPFRSEIGQGEDRIAVEQPHIAIEPRQRTAQVGRGPHGQAQRPEILAPHRSRCTHVDADIGAFGLGQRPEQRMVLRHVDRAARIGQRLTRDPHARQRPIRHLRVGLRDRLGRE